MKIGPLSRMELDGWVGGSTVIVPNGNDHYGINIPKRYVFHIKTACYKKLGQENDKPKHASPYSSTYLRDRKMNEIWLEEHL